jgi:hypothetical protein
MIHLIIYLKSWNIKKHDHFLIIECVFFTRKRAEYSKKPNMKKYILSLTIYTIINV